MEQHEEVLDDEQVPFIFRSFSQKIKLRDSKFPSSILRRASDIFNKLHGVKKTEKKHRQDIETSTIETIHQSSQANNHVHRVYKKIDESALEILQLILEIIDHYKNEK